MSRRQIMVLELTEKFQTMSAEMSALIEKLESKGFQCEDFKGAKKQALLKEAKGLNLSAELQTADYLRAEQILLSEKQIVRAVKPVQPKQEEKSCGLPIEAILPAGWKASVEAEKIYEESALVDLFRKGGNSPRRNDGDENLRSLLASL